MDRETANETLQTRAGTTAEGTTEKRKWTGLAAALFAVAALSVPLSAFHWAPIPLAAVLLAGNFFLTRRMRGGAWMTLVVSALGAPIFLWGASLGFLWLAAATAAFSGAHLLTFLRPRLRWLPAALAVLAFGLAAAILRAPLPALLALLVLPATYLLWAMTDDGGERRTAIVAITAAMFALPVVLVGLTYFAVRNGGTLTMEAVASLVDGWRTRTVAEITQALEGQLDILRNSASTRGAVPTLEQILNGRTVETYVNSFFNLLPAVVAVACEIPAFLAQRMLIGSYATALYTEGNGMTRVFFLPRVFTAALYALTVVLSFFGTPTTNRFFAVTENLRYILLPALCVAGVRVLWYLYLRSAPGARAVWWVGGLALFCCSPAIALGSLSVLGVYEVFSRALRTLASNLDRPDDGGE